MTFHVTVDLKVRQWRDDEIDANFSILPCHVEMDEMEYKGRLDKSFKSTLNVLHELHK